MFKNGNRRYKYLVLGHEESYFVKEHSDSKHKYSEDDIIKMLDFLVDNIFVVFAGKVFQQIVGIPMGTNCAPLLADISLYSYAPMRAWGVKSRMCPPYPQRDRKRRLNGAVCRNHRINRVVPCRC